MTVVIGTAGHIDHGKTTLLRALTGIDADRLPEERARGMTIDVGYAHLVLEDGTELDFVDVPGHDRLIGNMLVGAGEIDAALLVVAADDGPRAQTLEHIQLLDALGIEDGIAVVTKTDAVGADRVEEVVAAVRALIAPTSLGRRPPVVIPVSSTSGAGLADVRSAVIALRDRVLARAADGEAGTSRLAIDRVFSVRGRGTVVTGTLRGAAVRAGATLRVVPGEPGDTVRVRGIEVHGRATSEAGRGRAALNVTGEAVRALARGVVLTSDRGVVASDRVLVALAPGAGLPDLPADRTRVVVHVGTARVQAVLSRGGRDGQALSGREASAILRLEQAIAAAAGDRFVLRRPSPPETLAGGRILDPLPARGMARRRVTAGRLSALAGAKPGSETWAAARLDLHGALLQPTPRLAPDLEAEIDEHLVAAVVARPDLRRGDLVRAGAAALRRRVGRLDGPDGPDGSDRAPSPGAIDRLVGDRIEQLVAAGRLIRRGDRFSPPGVSVGGPTPDLLAAMGRLVDALTTVAPPPLSEVARAVGCSAEGIRILERDGRIVRLDADLAWAAATYADLAERAVTMAGQRPLTPAAYRDATATSRKYVMAILEDLDRRAILRRTATGHVPGPRAASLGRAAEAAT